MTERRVVLSGHARWEAERRGVAEETVIAVAARPEQVETVQPGREVRQSRIAFSPEGKTYLVRVFVDISEEEIVVVTAYRTSKVEKYWRQT